MHQSVGARGYIDQDLSKVVRKYGCITLDQSAGGIESRNIF